MYIFIVYLLLVSYLPPSFSQSNQTCATPQYPDIWSVPPDLFTPNITNSLPGAGIRIKQTTPGYENTFMYHTLYLPTNWKNSTSTKYPIIAEYTGNGPWSSPYGDYSCGAPDCSNLGYGLSKGENYIWVSLPFANNNGTQIERYWWGCVNSTITPNCTYNVTPTIQYTLSTIQYIVDTYHGDSKNVILTGWSRGALATMYVGLYDDTIASVWAGFAPYSHYDGRSTDQWVPYPYHDPASAIQRLQRLNNRSVFITEERNGTLDTMEFLNSTGLNLSNFQAYSTGFCNHDDQWVLRPSVTRTLFRQWLSNITGF